MAGGAIGIAATVYLKVGGVTGAVMFAFGLIVVVMMKLPLFTGQAQHVWSRRGTDLSLLGLMLLMNLGGCFLLSALTVTPEIREASQNIILVRLGKGPIICGFPHCIADSYYYASCGRDFLALHGWNLLAAYLPTVAGNYIGCNLYRLVIDMPAWFTPLTEREEASSGGAMPETDSMPRKRRAVKAGSAKAE